MGRTHDQLCPHKASPRFERRPVISSSWRNRIARQMPEYEAPPTPPDLQVAGPLTPAVNGAYYEDGTYKGKPYYRRKNGQPWYIWYDFEPPFDYFWYITRSVGGDLNVRWTWTGIAYEPPIQSYTPGGTAVGTAVVTAY